jgi:hypothetical protein
VFLSAINASDDTRIQTQDAVHLKTLIVQSANIAIQTILVPSERRSPAKKNYNGSSKRKEDNNDS